MDCWHDPIGAGADMPNTEIIIGDDGSTGLIADGNN
jgi:hypothetical protein